jgi:P-type Ca2+ transporter type 2C
MAVQAGITGQPATAGLAGLAITIGLLTLILYGASHIGSNPIGRSIAFTSFAFCLIVAAVEGRSRTGTVLTTATIDSKQMNWAIIARRSAARVSHPSAAT